MTKQEKISQAVSFIREKSRMRPKVGIVLGSGLGKIADQVVAETKIDYKVLPGFTPSSVTGHKGELILGRLNECEVAVLNGRTHYYEGHSFEEITFPIYVLKNLGVEYLIITSAAGSLKKKIKKGDIVLISDHINFLGENPLRIRNSGPNGINFIDLKDCYDEKLNSITKKIAKKLKIKIDEGNYFAVSGPTYETPAEVKAFSKLGGDIVGMSVVPEAITAKKLGIRACAVSYISNMASGMGNKPISHIEVLESAEKSSIEISKIISALAVYLYQEEK